MSAGNGVPFVDLITPHLELEEALLDAVRSVTRTASFVGGPAVEAFERNFARFCGVRNAIGVGSGTDALRFALIAAGVGEGDVVLTVPNTFVATIEAIVQARATPEFVDVDPDTFNIDVDALRARLEANGRPVKAIVPVHLYGQMCDMDAITSMAEEHGLVVIEDACQAHGSEYMSRKTGSWRKAGSLGTAGAFSFYPGKNLGACGEAGAVTTDDDELAGRVRMIRDHGQSRKYHHAVEGYNGRLDAIQAALLDVKLPHLDSWNAGRRRAAEAYAELLQSLEGLRPPVEPEWSRAVYHLYVVRAATRDSLQEHLTDRGIGTGLHYPIPLHLQPAYAHLGYREGDFPDAEAAAREILSLPMFPQILRAQQEQVTEAAREFFAVPAGER